MIVNAVRNNLFEQNLNQLDKEKYKNNCMQYGYIFNHCNTYFLL